VGAAWFEWALVVPTCNITAVQALSRPHFNFLSHGAFIADGLAESDVSVDSSSPGLAIGQLKTDFKKADHSDWHGQVYYEIYWVVLKLR